MTASNGGAGGQGAGGAGTQKQTTSATYVQHGHRARAQVVHYLPSCRYHCTSSCCGGSGSSCKGGGGGRKVARVAEGEYVRGQRCRKGTGAAVTTTSHTKTSQRGRCTKRGADCRGHVIISQENSPSYHRRAGHRITGAQAGGTDEGGLPQRKADRVAMGGDNTLKNKGQHPHTCTCLPGNYMSCWTHHRSHLRPSDGTG